MSRLAETGMKVVCGLVTLFMFAGFVLPTNFIALSFLFAVGGFLIGELS